MATYRDIDQWIRKYYGFSVKTCWIAHVKEIYGLNPRKASSRQGKTVRLNPCPLKKIKPIKHALSHFKMI